MTKTKNKTQFGFLMDRELKQKARHLLLDQGVSMAKWLEDALRELVEGASTRSKIYRVPGDLEEK